MTKDSRTPAPAAPGSVLWLTGPPASGKSTLARHLVAALRERGRVCLWLDSDDLRAVLTPAPTFDEAERDRFYAALAHLARLGAEGGALVVLSATAPRRRYRDALRATVSRFVEVELRCDRTLLEARDPKGLYAAARRGEVTRLPGVGVAYEPPLAPELVLDTGSLDAATAVERLLAVLERESRPATE
ncbi:MAG: adenylyl-sulfate kinase [Deltaproteobacteria bacterium]|nr:adenylyl-sulfate kinase [Deltaproteobacteria bacterium]